MKKEAIKPLGENVLVKVLKKDARTKSGIVLPDTASEDRPQEGKVMEIGDSPKIKVKKNQTVLFAKYSGTEIKMNNEDYLILKNEDILAVVK